MNISPKTLLAVVGGVIVMIFIAVGAALFSGSQTGPTDIADLPPQIAADRTAPSARNNPMVPVTAEEASRRSTLHNELERNVVERAPSTVRASADPTGTVTSGGGPTYIAPPVVTEVRSADADDELTRALFDQNAEFVVTPPARLDTSTPEPGTGEPLVTAMIEPDPAPEPEPEPAPEPAPEPEPEIAQQPQQADIYAPYRDQLRQRFDFYEYGNDYNYGNKIIVPKQQQSFLGLLMSAFVGTAHAGGYVAPVETMGEPIFVPYYDAGRLRIGIEDLYGPPLPHERSAARPELVGHNPFGGAYATQEYHSQRMVTQAGGRQVLARAGDIVFARLLYGFNSDDTRGLPIYGTITDIMQNGDFGPLHDARIEGVIAYTNDQATASFNRILLADGRDIPMTGIAISHDAARTGFAQRVNRHTLQRYSSLFLAGLMEGVGSIAEARYGNRNSGGNTIIVGDGSNVTIENGRPGELTDRELIYGAAGPIGRHLGNTVAQGFNRPPTISAPAGHIFGVVFVQTLIFDPATVAGVPAYNPRTGGMADANFMQTVTGNPAAPPTAVPAPGQPMMIQQGQMGQAVIQQPGQPPAYVPVSPYGVAGQQQAPVGTIYEGATR